MKKHPDINGKEIKIGDVVVIHKATVCWTIDKTKLFEGNIGVVIEFGFGCVRIQTNDIVWDDTVSDYYFDSQEVEVIGKL
jgi:hypothetical protein